MLLSNSTKFRILTFDRYLIVDYERSNFSVNPCIFTDNTQQNISPIRSIDSSNETGTNTSNGTSSPTHHIFPGQSLSSPAVAGITIAAVLGLLILLASLTLFIFANWGRIRRRRLRSRPYPTHERYRNEDTFGELHAHEPGLAPEGLQRTCEFNELQGTPCELDDIESLQHETEGIQYSPFPQDLRQKFAQHPAMTSTSKVASASDISWATSPSSLTSENVMETANDSDHVLTSSHSTPTKIIESKTDDMPSFDVLEAGHWTLAIWPSIAEDIRVRYRDIMGVGNAGSINLLACISPGSLDLNSQDPSAPSSAAICISCKYPDRANRRVLQDILGSLRDLPIFIRSGSIRRSGYEEGCCCPREGECPCQGKRLASEFEFGPAAYGRYMQRPDCGASIGVSDASLERERVSLGGYISLNIGNQWVLKAVTCHHLIDDSSVETPGIQSWADGTSNSGTPGIKYSIQSSAKIDHDGEVKRLWQRVQDNNQSSRKVESTNIMDAYKYLANAQLRFGEARCSSGIAIDAVENLQV